MVIDGISYIPSNVLLSEIHKTAIKDDRAFALLDPRGESPRAHSPHSPLGFFRDDTRFISIWETTINGDAPVPLSRELRPGGSTLIVSMTNRDLQPIGSFPTIPRDSFLIRRIISLVNDQVHEWFSIRNYSQHAQLLQIEQWIGSRFDDLFEVRGYHRSARGKILGAREETIKGGRLTQLRYEGLDGLERSTYIRQLFECEKIRLAPGLLGVFTRVEVPPKADVVLITQAGLGTPVHGRLEGEPLEKLSITTAMDRIHILQTAKIRPNFHIESDNALFNRALEGALQDLSMLLTRENGGDLYPYAGIPWFSAPFGRDGLISAYQLLPWHPALARGVLNYVFSHLGVREDSFTEEQPGRVFHELRRGEMAATREIPFIPYFGSVDATPLALILLHDYFCWTQDRESLERWWPEALRALHWLEDYGDPDRDGLIEYNRKSPTGLANQGWKDSHDSVMHQDGTLAQAPIRLCEVQAYAYRARLGMAELARIRGATDQAVRWEGDAHQLRALFQKHFWDPESGSIHLALDAEKRPCRVLSSNMGHCLWTGILDPEQSRKVGAHLMGHSLFSGHGIRTLADTEAAYNPLSYHNGSVWPHDNSLILQGFRTTGQQEHLQTLAQAMISVLETSGDFRLPELYCGFRKRGNEPPVPYEVACKPQVWAAGSLFLLLRAILGIRKESPDQVVFDTPWLPESLSWLRVQGLRGPGWELDFRVRRTEGAATIEVERRSGPVQVISIR